jgi:hypothetical protein
MNKPANVVEVLIREFRHVSRAFFRRAQATMEVFRIHDERLPRIAEPLADARPCVICS